MHLVKILLTYVYIDIQLYATRKPYQSTFDIHATFQRYSSNVCIFWYNVHKSMWTFWAAYALLEFFLEFHIFSRLFMFRNKSSHKRIDMLYIHLVNDIAIVSDDFNWSEHWDSRKWLNQLNLMFHKNFRKRKYFFILKIVIVRSSKIIDNFFFLATGLQWLENVKFRLFFIKKYSFHPFSLQHSATYYE